jgi:hypothetical protein
VSLGEAKEIAHRRHGVLSALCDEISTAHPYSVSPHGGQNSGSHESGIPSIA